MGRIYLRRTLAAAIQSVRELEALLDRMHRIGASQIAEAEQVRVWAGGIRGRSCEEAEGE